MKRVLVTGGSRGIGRACVEYFSNIGYKVAFVYANNEDAARDVSENFGAYAIKADVSKPDGAKRAVADAVAHLGGIDILVNNAGVAQIKLCTDITDDDYDRMISTNLSRAT